MDQNFPNCELFLVKNLLGLILVTWMVTSSQTYLELLEFIQKEMWAPFLHLFHTLLILDRNYYYNEALLGSLQLLKQCCYIFTEELCPSLHIYLSPLTLISFTLALPQFSLLNKRHFNIRYPPLLTPISPFHIVFGCVTCYDRLALQKSMPKSPWLKSRECTRAFCLQSSLLEWEITKLFTSQLDARADILICLKTVVVFLPIQNFNFCFWGYQQGCKWFFFFLSGSFLFCARVVFAHLQPESLTPGKSQVKFESDQQNDVQGPQCRSLV